MLDYEEYFFIGERSKTFDPFIDETKWVLNCSVTLCCEPRYIAGYCIVLKNDKNFQNLPVPYVDSGNATFLGSKIYFFSCSSRQHELRPSEYEHNDTISVML